MLRAWSGSRPCIHIRWFLTHTMAFSNMICRLQNGRPPHHLACRHGFFLLSLELRLVRQAFAGFGFPSSPTKSLSQTQSSSFEMPVSLKLRNVLKCLMTAQRERPQSKNTPQTSTLNQGKQISRTELDALDSSNVTHVFKPNVLREAIVSDRVTSRVDGFRYRGCRGCCFAVLVGACGRAELSPR